MSDLLCLIFGLNLICSNHPVIGAFLLYLAIFKTIK